VLLFDHRVGAQEVSAASREWTALVSRSQQEDANMNRYVTVGLSMLVGAVLAGAAIEALHAQAKPPVYYIAEINVTDPEGYGKDYAPKARAMIEAAGGRFVAIGGAADAGAKETVVFDGEAPKRFNVQVWADMAKLKSWRASPAYQVLRQDGEQYAKFRAYAVEGLAQ
jgi:uncharacterized protein (DUF1330 family)